MLFQQADMLRDVCQALGREAGIGRLDPASTISQALIESIGRPKVEYTMDTMTSQPTPLLQSIRFRASRIASISCDPFCSCTCHARYQIKTPLSLQNIIGSLFIGYTGFPSWMQGCNERSCSRQTKSVTQFSYSFPSWLLTRSIVGRITPAPELLLSMSRVIPSRSAVFHHSMLGDADKIRDLFTKRLASPFDVAPSGSSVLHVNTLVHILSNSENRG
jgi:hypothetical protein